MDYRFDTLQIHGGFDHDPVTGAKAVPVYRSAAYAFRDTAHAAGLFNSEEKGHIYSRISNPTVEVLENRLALLEGGVGAVATASGTAAILYAVLNLAANGDEIISSKAIYGGTTHLFEGILKDMGIRVHFVDIADHQAVKDLINENTRLIFTETVGNPMNVVADIEALSTIAHGAGLPLIVDATVSTPYLLRPFEFGADIVVHSLTKFIGGHGLAIGGAVIDSGKSDWSRFKRLSQPDPDCQDINFSEKFASAAYITRLRSVLLRDMGACLSPVDAQAFLIGLETLSLRMQRHCANALMVARFLENHPAVAWVNYPGLENHPDHDLTERYLPKGSGGIISFGPLGGYQAAEKIVNAVKLITHLANIGDAKSLIIHPASTTHRQLSPAQQLDCGVLPEMIRLSVGIEDCDDILDDLGQALG